MIFYNLKIKSVQSSNIAIKLKLYILKVEIYIEREKDKSTIIINIILFKHNTCDQYYCSATLMQNFTTFADFNF